MSGTVRDFSETPMCYLTYEIQFSEPRVTEAVTREIYEHKRDIHGIEPAGILLDPKRAAQLSRGS